jgi:hypothetical protein
MQCGGRMKVEGKIDCKSLFALMRGRAPTEEKGKQTEKITKKMRKKLLESRNGDTTDM